jgi:antitoxin component YwqK of YwqJK toxin-antitoxin module
LTSKTEQNQKHNIMKNFDLKNFLTENKLTKNSKLVKEYLEDGGSAADAFREAGLGDSDMVKLRVDNEQTLGPVSVAKAVAFVEKKSNNGEMERQYSFDDIEGDGAVLNISIADSITIDVYRA